MYQPNKWGGGGGSLQPRTPHIVQLLSNSVGDVTQAEKRAINHKLLAVIRNLGIQPQNVKLHAYNSADLAYEQWSQALTTVVHLWELKLNDKEFAFLPNVITYAESLSYRELNDRLKFLFLDKLRGFKGKLVEKWMKKLQTVKDECKSLSDLLTQRKQSNELLGKKEGLEVEMSLILNRVEEFKRGISCIEYYLVNDEKYKEEDINVFQFVGGKIEWERIYMLMMRECRRLDDGLSIFAHRRDIVKQIHSQQVTILKGETGSGKSTQLVQFLADSGVCGQGSIVCTQPCKLAAISLAERVKKESCGCSSVNCYPSYSSLWEFEYHVVFMTDHCILQHYMRNQQLSRISCIVVDEAHERSLNTDILLASIKNLLSERPCLKLIIMSPTVDADRFAEYFLGSRTLLVAGRNFPVAVKYEPHQSKVILASTEMPPYVHDVLNMVLKINRTEKEGTILAFLTSQREVEWACKNFQDQSAIGLTLHLKSSYENQLKIYLTYPDKRKVIFATNIAETSFTIPGVKYVVDSGNVEESVYEPATGLYILKVCKINQSSAKLRAGCAGRTEPGTCYRLYTKNDFESMLSQQEPEICKVHLGLAVLKMIALGMKDVNKFDFVDAPCATAIDMAVRNLIQIAAITVKGDGDELTKEGREIAMLGIEPRLGKLILQSFRQQLGKEGLVLAAVMTNSRSIFCRVGNEEAKLKSDCLNVLFSHAAGDLFTLLGVYKEWEALPYKQKNRWCWENSINAKSLKRCQDTVKELEDFLQDVLNIIVPTYWIWNPQIYGEEHEKILKNIMLSSLPENVAMYSGNDQLGYKVALTGKLVHLHPSCSLLNFNVRPAWVIFSEIISASSEYLACGVTACDFDSFSALYPPLPFDFLEMNGQQLQKRVLSGCGRAQLNRFRGGNGSNVGFLTSKLKESHGGIIIDIGVDKNEVHLYAPSQNMEEVMGFVKEALEYENERLQNECLEELLYIGKSYVVPSIALFGAGAEIKHLELEKRHLSVDIHHSNVHAIYQKELLHFLESYTMGRICSVRKSWGISGKENYWGTVTFLTLDAAKKAVDLKKSHFSGGLLNVIPSKMNYNYGLIMKWLDPIGCEILWPRRVSTGTAIVTCDPNDVAFIVEDLDHLEIGGRTIVCEPHLEDSFSVTNLDRELSDDDIYQELRTSTNRQIKNVYLVRGEAVDNPSRFDCEKAIRQHIYPFMPKNNWRVDIHVHQPQPDDNFMRAVINFEGRLHLEAARVLEHLNGKVLLLPGFHPWQKMICHPPFFATVFFYSFGYRHYKNDLHALLNRIRRQHPECNIQLILKESRYGLYKVEISASSTRLVFLLKKSVEELMKGTIIQHPDITPAVFDTLCSPDGVMLSRSIQQETRTHIFIDEEEMAVIVYGPPARIEHAQQRLVEALLGLHNRRHVEIQLNDGSFPPDIMKRVVKHFGADLSRLIQKVPGVKLSLNARRHAICIEGNQELKHEVENIIYDLAGTSKMQSERTCPICLCEVEEMDSHVLEACRHEACRSCLVEQCKNAIRNHNCFPLVCARERCGAKILVADLSFLLSKEKLNKLFRASLSAYVEANGGTYKFCPSKDCPSVYRVADHDAVRFECEVCYVHTCTKCHSEFHPGFPCDINEDSALNKWLQTKGQEKVNVCPGCGCIIEKAEGCNHVACRCGRHICWICMMEFPSACLCERHILSVHTSLF